MSRGCAIRTGSVTAMAKVGAGYGLGLLRVLAFSCLFSGVLMSGVLAAGLSSIFPILMIAPLMHLKLVAAGREGGTWA